MNLQELTYFKLRMQAEAAQQSRPLIFYFLFFLHREDNVCYY